MSISENEKNQILKDTEFLNKKGFNLRFKEHMIIYTNNKIEFIIIFEPFSDLSDINIKFIAENKIYSIGWIASVRKGISFNSNDRIKDILVLLKYLQEEYDKIIQLTYCQESDKLVDDFIAKNKH